MMTNLSAAFRERVAATFGSPGSVWLSQLPFLMTKAEVMYHLEIGEQYSHQSFNVTAKAVWRGDQPVVVKFCAPSEEFAAEVCALQHMAGEGMVQLLAFNEPLGLLVLERAVPGEMLVSLSEDLRATEIAAELMPKLWRPVASSAPFKTTQQWFKRLDQPLSLPPTFPVSWIDKARLIANELHDGMSEPVLLHGDLHHFNILSAERQPWFAIDPKGVIGEPAYEVGAFLRNPIPSIVQVKNLRRVLTNRLDIFANRLGFDRQRLQAWSFAQAVLASVWAVDGDSKDWPLFLACAEVLEV